MQQLEIENPKTAISTTLPWLDFKSNIFTVVSRFPQEYSIIKEYEDQKICLLNTPLTEEHKNQNNDQLIYVTHKGDGNIEYEITNEKNQLASFNELEKNKKALNVFCILVDQSIKGTLGKVIEQSNETNEPQVDAFQGIIQIIIVIVSLIGIFMALKVFM